MTDAAESRAVVLVEGTSDAVAVEALAARLGRDLGDEGVAIVPIGGSKNITRFLERFGLGVTLAGLCDEAEEGDFRRGLERAEMGAGLSRARMEELGFYVCVADLEDELIRALGAPVVERVLEAEGDLGAFRTFQKQPPWRDHRAEVQLHRFMNNRKIRIASALVDALDLDRVPRPLAGVLEHVRRG